MQRAFLKLMFFHLMICGVVFAGDIKGKLTGKETGSEAVVWVEGVKGFKVPTEKPAISQTGAKFSPHLLVVVAGQTVSMPNDDQIIHNVFSKSPAKSFNLGFYAQGEARDVTFEKPGIVSLFCSLHRQMNAKIVIVPNPYFAQATLGGDFVIKGVPAGKYVLKAWTDGAPEKTLDVTVPESGNVVADFSFVDSAQK